jgi:nucleotide-binding universal stress UspA family protein
MKILLAVDSSPLAEPVIAEVAARSWPTDSVVVVLTVIDLFALTSSLGYLEPFIKNENDAARALVESVSKRLVSNGVETVTQVVEGHPGNAIVDQAQQWNADFIFVGSHGHGGLGRLVLGSIAKQVVRNASCSVAVIRAAANPATTGKRILLAVDGSAYAEAAVRSVAERQWPADTEVRIVSVVDLIIPVVDPLYGSGEVMEEIRAENRRMCEQAAAAAHRTISAAGLKSTPLVLAGSPKWCIIDEAREWGADIIVVGSHGRRGLIRMLLGSVSEAVAVNAASSVEVIRSRELLAVK